MGRVAECAGKNPVMAPKSGARPAIMVVNNPVKNESKHFENDGSKYFLRTVKPLGFNPSDFYYTSPIKCKVSKVADVSKACQAKCMDWLRTEISMVNPKLIICFATNALRLFGVEKKSMAEMNGEVIYSKQFDAYVLFSYSPQYAYFNDDIQGKFQDSMNILREIIAE